MDKIVNDKRFKHIATDPRFKNVPRKEKKIKIDKRFQAMFTDKRFQLKYSVDSRGRQLDELQTENYKKYYDLSDSSEGSSSADEDEDRKQSDDIPDSKVENELSEGSESGEDTQLDKLSSEKKETPSEEVPEEAEKKVSEKEKRKEALQAVNRYIDEVHKKTLINEKVREKLEDATVDYARGIGTLLSESSSDESTSEESDVEDIEHPWGELDQDADQTEEVTSRLAVCNLDWDRVSAKDLMVLFHSFLPPTGLIHSIKIYPSEFGLARMKEEELKGPKELVEHDEEVILEPEEEENETEEGSEYQREKLRQYQLKRLRYFYGVVECDSAPTANLLYTECDGWEFESSATRIDLRFIPDGEVFHQKPREVCTSLPDLKKYKPRLFINKALQQGKVELTWDETDPDRIEFNRNIFEKSEKIDENDLQNFIASASSEESDEDERSDEDQDKSCEDENEAAKSTKGGKDVISKYRSLISQLKKEEDKKSKRNKFVDSDEEKNGHDKEDSDEKENGNSESGRSEADTTTESSSDELVSDADEKPAAGSLKRGDSVKKRNSKKVGKKNKQKKEKIENSEDEEAKAELELLLCDSNNVEMERRHFSLEKIQKEEKENKKKRKWKRKKKEEYREEDPFKLDLSDERFSAIYTSHHFNIDPADPHFRKTKAMEELIAEKQKRRRLQGPSH